MKILTSFRRIGALSLLLWSAASPSSATVFVRMDDAELFDQASLVVEGWVRSADSAGQGRAAVRLTVEVVTPLKSHREIRPPELEVLVPGGVRGDGLALHILGAPRLRPGDRALLFLEPRGDGSYQLVHFLLGAFHLLDRPGGTVAVRDLSGAHELFPDRPELPRDGLRSWALFEHWLEDRGEGKHRDADYFLAREKNAAGPSPDKFQTIVSSTEPFPFGCGANGGHNVRWFEFDRGDQVRWRTYFTGQPGLVDGGLEAFRGGLEAWNRDPATPIDLTFDGLTAASGGLIELDGTSTILFDDPNQEIAGTFVSSGVLAIGGPWFNCDLETVDGESFHIALEGDIVTQDGLETFFFATGDSRSAAEELFGHELGHTLGLAHSADPEALMFAQIHQDGRGAQLANDDLEAIRFLYGFAPQAPPEAPTDLVAGALSPSRVRLDWTDRSSDETGFRVERRADGPFAVVGSAGPDETGFEDLSVLPGVVYTYRVRAQIGGVGSTYSNEATVETPLGGLPASPRSLRAAPLSTSRLRLTWQDLSDNESEFRLFVLAPATDTFVEIPVSIPHDITSVVLGDLEPGRSFTFQILARNPAGDSQPSNPVQVTTFAEGAPCVVSPSELCLEAGRFRVGVTFRNRHSDGSIDSAGVIPGTDNTGLVWFFDPGNIELILKIVDGRTANGHFWVYYGGISDLEYWITITDTRTGLQQIYHNEPGEICGGADDRAFFDPAPGALGPPPVAPLPLAFRLETDPFPSPPGRSGQEAAKQAGACQPDPETLCLLDQRLALTLEWADPRENGELGEGAAAALSGASGDFWFFEPEISEVMVKALDGGSYNGHYWIFFGALTDLEYWLTATDPATGASKTYYNPPGNLCGQADILAFPAPATP